MGFHDPILTVAYFSNGLVKPPTRFVFVFGDFVTDLRDYHGFHDSMMIHQPPFGKGDVFLFWHEKISDFKTFFHFTVAKIQDTNTVELSLFFAKKRGSSLHPGTKITGGPGFVR